MNNFFEHNVSLEKCPALVLNADYRPLSYYPLSLWSWQDTVKSVFLDRVIIVSNYDRVIDRINNLELSNNPYLSNIEYVNQTGESVFDTSKSESDQIIQIQNILARTLIAWLSVIFLLGITGVFI